MPATVLSPDRARTLSNALWTGLTLVAVLLWSRQRVGEFTGPLPAVWVIAWTLIVAGVSGLAAWLASPQTESPAVPTTIAVGLGCLATFAGLPGLSAGALGLVLGLWLLGGLLVWGALQGDQIWGSIVSDPPTIAVPVPEPAVFAGEIDEDSADDAVQTMFRRLTEDGEVIEGSLLVTLSAGERDSTVHLSFCPPLTATPAVEAEDIDGFGWEIKVAAAYPFGIRLQIRRGQDCSEDITGRVAYWACAAPVTRAA